MFWRVHVSKVLVVLCATGCVGAVGEGSDSPAQPEPVPSVVLHGQTIDFFANVPVADVAIETLGLAPERTGTSSAAGDFELNNVPDASRFYIRSAGTETHRSSVTLVDTEAGLRDLYVVSIADVQRQHVTVGVERVPDSTMIIVDVVDGSGTPVGGISRSDITLTSDTGELVAVEPFVFGAIGDVDPSLTTSDVSNGSSRFGFLNVPAGVHLVTLTCNTCTPAFESSQSVIAAGGVSFADIVTVEAAPPESSFAAVFGLFARGVDGGLGCANCHTAGAGVSPVLDGDLELVHDTLVQTPGLVEPTDPDRSLLLSAPLYETPANHPNATFLSRQDASYQAIRTWIEAGAQL